ncbi:MAG: hypothetical protein RIM23_12180 [Coleofasciculus sp. G3-WIS-01]|uniref:hypothetical protein n=1 Tax=Coleofasciculus sp. G3-WIS-01 TaxID=3069528 RepID=UPI00330358B0
MCARFNRQIYPTRFNRQIYPTRFNRQIYPTRFNRQIYPTILAVSVRHRGQYPPTLSQYLQS